MTTELSPTLCITPTNKSPNTTQLNVKNIFESKTLTYDANYLANISVSRLPVMASLH